MGKKKINQTCIREIALEANVSTATVSRVFNRYEHVSPATRKKVMEIAKKGGYAPNVASTKMLFGILAGGADNYVIESYKSQMLESISSSLFAMGYNVQIFSHNLFPYILRNTFRGVFVFSAEDAEFFRKAQIPCVVVNEPAPGVCNVATDHEESLRIAMEYLWEQGHRKIAYLHNGTGNWGAMERLKGFHHFLLEAGIEEKDHLAYGYRNPAKDIPAGIEILLKEHPTALIVEGEAKGIIADSTLKKLHIRIPEDLSLITFENPLVSSYLVPAHTTVCQDFDKLGKYAAETMVQYVLETPKRRKIPPIKFFHNHLIIRQSCRELKKK